MSEIAPGPQDDERRARFDALYARVHADLWRYCLRRVWPQEDAEDLMADVLAVVWRKLEEVPEAPSDRPYVFAIARNHVRDRRRRTARRDRILQLAAAREERDTEVAWATGHPGGDDPAEAGQLDAVRDAFAKLSDNDAEVLRLAIWDELPHRDIARVLGISEGAVAVRLHRARRRLRRHMALGADRDPGQDSGQDPGQNTDPPQRTAGDVTPARAPRSATQTPHSSGGSR